MLRIDSIGDHWGIYEITVPAYHTLEKEFRILTWMNFLISKSGKSPDTFTEPPEDFQPEYYSYKNLERLPPKTLIANVPAPGIVIILYDTPLTVDLFYIIIENDDRVKLFIQNDNFISNQKKCDIFISYANADSHNAETIKKALEKKGIHCFMAEKELQAGDIWAEEIRSALVDSKEMCILCTPTSIKSEWVITELGAAWALNKRIIPVLHRLDISQLPERLRSRECVDLSDFDECIEQIYRRLKAGI